MMASMRNVGKILPTNSTLFLCDMQEKFRENIKYFPQIVEVSRRMLGAARVLKMPVIVTEQYPKGLGSTVPELDVKGLSVYSKTIFSMCIPEVEKVIETERKSALICGIEAHACIQQTVLDLIEKDFDVHVIVDAVSSRSMVDRMYAFERMKNVGAYLTTSESVMLMLTRDAKHPSFKEIQKFIMKEAPDSGLLLR